MPTTILNIGIGHFILAFVWVICVTACIVLTRTGEKGKLTGPACIIVAAIVTIVLWLIPREDINVQTVADFKIYDQTIVGRTVVISALALVLLVAIAMFMLDHVMMPIYAKPLKKLR